MAGQLIYTSAPRGLVAGQTGYCTVARDGDLREALVRTLEQSSSFNHAASAGQHNPVVSAYRVIDLRGAKFHVLSKIQDAGLDFSNRTNHLAHHLVFEPHELANLPSPAIILRDWNGWRKEWKEAPRLLGPSDWGNFSQLPRSVSLPAKNWQGATGDAGSAAGLLEFPGGVFLLASSETLLPIFAESTQLLALKSKSGAESWEYTFTTRLQPEDNPNDFRWRGCQTDGPVYQTLSRKGTSFVAVNSIKAPANDLAQYARTGKLPAAEVKIAIPTPTPTKAPVVTQVASPPTMTRPTPKTPTPVRSVPKGWDKDPNTFEQEEDEEFESSSSSNWMLWSVVIVALVAIVGVWFLLRSPKAEVTTFAATNVTSVPTNSTASTPTNTTATVVEQPPVPPLPTNPAPRPSSSMDATKWVEQLPDFKTYLVGGTKDGTSVAVENIDDLKKACDQLKEITSSVEMISNVECRLRKDKPIIAESSDDSKATLSLDGSDLTFSQDGLNFSIKEWRSLEAPSSGITVIDFKSPDNKFGKFRVACLPLGAANEPMRFPKSLLRTEQGSVRASFEQSLSNRIAKFEPHDGSLKLRPFVEAKDMIDSLTEPYKSQAEKGNGLDFAKLRRQINNDISTTSSNLATVQGKIDQYNQEMTGYSIQISAREKDKRTAERKPDGLKEVEGAKTDIQTFEGKKKESKDNLGKAQTAKDQLDVKLAAENKCLSLIPADLSDSKLDHVDLVFVPENQNNPNNRIELIRFDDSGGAK